MHRARAHCGSTREGLLHALRSKCRTIELRLITFRCRRQERAGGGTWLPPASRRVSVVCYGRRLSGLEWDRKAHVDLRSGRDVDLLSLSHFMSAFVPAGPNLVPVVARLERRRLE